LIRIHNFIVRICNRKPVDTSNYNELLAQI